MDKFPISTCTKIKHTILITISIIMIIGIGHCYATTTSQDAYINLAQKKLPNQLGIYNHIKFMSGKNIDVYETTLTGNYHAYIYQQPANNQVNAKSIAELIHEQHFLIGINGGFYAPDFHPVGLFIVKGKVLQQVIKDPLATTCVRMDRKEKILLENNNKYCLNAYYAMQTGPLLIERSNISPDVNILSQKLIALKSFFAPHYRTILALAQDQKLIVMVTSEASLSDVANILKNYPEAFGAKSIYTAIDLDGGSSTGMYIEFENGPLLFSGTETRKNLYFL